MRSRPGTSCTCGRRVQSYRSGVSYPDDLLVEGERVVLHTHPHVKMLALPVLALLLVVAAGSFLAALVSAQGWAGWAWLGLGVLGAFAIWRFTLRAVLRWRTTHFVVTTRRVLTREGIVSRQGIDIPMARISGVQFRHTMAERLLGCGTLVIESSAEEQLEFPDVPRVQRVHGLLFQEVADDE